MNYLKLTTYRAGMLQARAYRNLAAFMTRTLAPYNLSITEWAMLGLLFEAKENSQPGDMSEQLGVTKPLISRFIKHLDELGFLEIHNHASDARASILKLSPAGEAMVAKVERELRGQMRTYLKGISLRQLASYLAVLEQLATREP